MHYYFAPMEGVTGAVYRRTHHEFFSGVDKYFMPFITPTTNEKLTPRQKRDVLPEYNEGVPAVPQLLTKSAADCIWAVNALHDLGYPEVNLNLGCPSGTVTAKGKGAGFLAHPDELDNKRFENLFIMLPTPFQKGDIVLGRILFEKLLIDAEFALMDAAAPCQNGVDVLLRNSKSGGFFFLRFCDNFLLLFNCGERYA